MSTCFFIESASTKESTDSEHAYIESASTDESARQLRGRPQNDIELFKNKIYSYDNIANGHNVKHMDGHARDQKTLPRKKAQEIT